MTTLKSKIEETTEGPYLRRSSAACYLGVSPRCLSNWMRSGIVPFRRVGKVVLFRRDELDQALDRYRNSAVGELR